jgi:hypothetical protein
VGNASNLVDVAAANKQRKSGIIAVTNLALVEEMPLVEGKEDLHDHKYVIQMLLHKPSQQNV